MWEYSGIITFLPQLFVMIIQSWDAFHNSPSGLVVNRSLIASPDTSIQIEQQPSRGKSNSSFLDSSRILSHLPVAPLVMTSENLWKVFNKMDSL